MRKVLFWIEDWWAFGTIHHGLVKELYKKGIYSNFLDWNKSLTPQEWDLVLETYDLVVTKTDLVPTLHAQLGIPLNRIVAVAHAEWDLLLTTKGQDAPEWYGELYAYGVVSPYLCERSSELGIARTPSLVSLGVHFELFYRSPSLSLSTVGYAGAVTANDFWSRDIKRGHLVELAIPPEIKLKRHERYRWMCMPAYYSSVDAIAVSSTQEGAGLPSMEAASAGRLVFSTPVGVFREHGPKGGGVTLPIEEELLPICLREELLRYHRDPEAYHSKCREIQEYARENYDWSKHIDRWAEFLA